LYCQTGGQWCGNACAFPDQARKNPLAGLGAAVPLEQDAEDIPLDIASARELFPVYRGDDLLDTPIVREPAVGPDSIDKVFSEKPKAFCAHQHLGWGGMGGACRARTIAFRR